MQKNTNHIAPYTSFFTKIELLIFCCSVMIYYFFCNPIFIDGDIAWHIGSGYLIRELGEVPYYDPWSYAGQLQRWYNISWLWDIFLSYFDQIVGLGTLTIICALSFGWLILLIHKFLCQRFGISKNSKYNTTGMTGISYDSLLIALTLIVLCLPEFFNLRASFPTFFLILWTLWLIFGYYEKKYNFTNIKDYSDSYNITDLTILIKNFRKHFKTSAGKIFIEQQFNKLAIKLIFIMLIWANVHGSFILMFIFIGAIFIDAFYKEDFTMCIRWIILSIFLFLVTLINPIGYNLYFGVMRTLNSNYSKSSLEWISLWFGMHYGMSLLIGTLLLCGLSFRKKYANLKLTMYEWLLFIIFVFAALTSIRNFSVLCVAGAAAIAALVDQSLPKSKIPMKFADMPIHLRFVGYLNIAGVILMFIFTPSKIGYEMTPKKEIEFIANNYPGMNFFMPYTAGGYAIYFAKGKFKHFVDGRAGTVFPEQVLEDWFYYTRSDKQWMRVFDQYQVDGALVPRNDLGKISVYNFLKNWQVVYNGPLYVIFVKRAVVKMDGQGNGEVMEIRNKHVVK